MRRFFVQNFGCRATQADGAALEGLLRQRGLEPSGDAAGADVVIINTCTVTAAADEDARKAIHRVHRENPAARIVVTGCYAQRAPQELAQVPGVAWVVGNSHKAEIAGLLERLEIPAEYHGQVLIGDIREQVSFLSAPVEDAPGDRTRPNLKIQDGCNNPCAFCIIPAVRGPSRSMPEEEVLARVRALAERYAEIVLTGVNLGRWGRERGFAAGRRLHDLLRRILEETNVRRLRISSVEPMDWTDELIDLMASSPRIAPHVHMPLQSGSDAMLRRMKRRYRVRHYEDRLLRAARCMPDAAFGADVMTGFPGETEAEFEETLEFVARMPFTYLHVFTYSERPGTPAAAMPGPVPWEVRKERTRRLRQLAAEKNLAFRRRMIGRTLSAVTLGGGRALTANYLSVALARPREANEIVDVRIGSLAPEGLAESGALPVMAG
ncbi:MAG: tRNA (N(6)-L-threonylcarbamoyladenosine(37)-C(2))-methylthiotransferase MtaB [Bryobacteraceae bacterium]|nr:tRNA (N(6)-L-threonylcarbamoyladenosine(37)-C(2))-methylthiotransferase MtaB [Bryobacteraceae bacterium]